MAGSGFDISGLQAEIEAWAMAMWASTITVLNVFAILDLRTECRALAPGPKTGTLDSAIFSEGHTTGQWSYWAGAGIGSATNPETGHDAAYYGYLWNYGHVNPWMGWTYQPAKLFMEGGSEAAYSALDGKLLALGWQRG